MKLQQQKNGMFQITLPKDIVKGFGWKKADQLDYRIIGEGQLKLFRKKE